MTAPHRLAVDNYLTHTGNTKYAPESFAELVRDWIDFNDAPLTQFTRSRVIEVGLEDVDDPKWAESVVRIPCPEQKNHSAGTSKTSTCCAVNMVSGRYRCFVASCGASGKSSDFQKAVKLAMGLENVRVFETNKQTVAEAHKRFRGVANGPRSSQRGRHEKKLNLNDKCESLHYYTLRGSDQPAFVFVRRPYWMEEGKGVWGHRAQNNVWMKTLGGRKPDTLYNELRLNKADKKGWVFVSESEKDVDYLQDFIDKRYAKLSVTKRPVAVSWYGGAGAVTSQPEVWNVLDGRTNVVLWPDNDKSGMDAMRKLAKTRLIDTVQNLYGIPVQTLGKPEGWDIYDCIEEGTDPLQLIKQHKKRFGKNIEVNAQLAEVEVAAVEVSNDEEVVDTARKHKAQTNTIPLNRSHTPHFHNVAQQVKRMRPNVSKFNRTEKGVGLTH